MTDTPTPPPGKVRIGPLDTIAGVRTEFTRLYRAARRGEVDVKEAARLAYILTGLRETIAAESFEAKLVRFEKWVDEQEQPGGGR